MKNKRHQIPKTIGIIGIIIVLIVGMILISTFLLAPSLFKASGLGL